MGKELRSQKVGVRFEAGGGGGGGGGACAGDVVCRDGDVCQELLLSGEIVSCFLCPLLCCGDFCKKVLAGLVTDVEANTPCRRSGGGFTSHEFSMIDHFGGCCCQARPSTDAAVHTLSARASLELLLMCYYIMTEEINCTFVPGSSLVPLFSQYINTVDESIYCRYGMRSPYYC